MGTEEEVEVEVEAGHDEEVFEFEEPVVTTKMIVLNKPTPWVLAALAVVALFLGDIAWSLSHIEHHIGRIASWGDKRLHLDLNLTNGYHWH